mmetsp:Transcript_52033/g.114186  ORF Transcript_52033/g.114186 Transcript_52033/m.114186 type:complete len:584 (+) Transcript_52033:85-1836(+)
MCGILALLGLAEDAETWRKRALELAKLLRHRGPDWSGIYCKGNHILCHERLAIVDPDSGEQPFFTADKQVILAANGEIYNHKQLRAELKGEHTFLTGSDCEVLMHMFVEDGAGFLKKHRVNGMYAFVAFNENDGSFMAARDPIGIMPLYWGWGKDGSVWFSSEMKALNNDCEKFELFPPGCYYDSKSGKVERFYEPEWWSESHIPSTPINYKYVRDEFERSIVRHLMADVPYGVLLSGGLDSSLVASIVQRHVAFRTEDYSSDGGVHHKSHWPVLHSFCIGLPGSPDLQAAQKVADMIGTIHHSYTFTVEQGIDALSDVIFHLETYDVTTIRASTPMFLMSRKIKALGVKMVLSGEGADEMLGGYLYFHKAPNKEEFHKELVRKIKDLHKYDCLRCNKSTMAWGLEARVPFLDRDFLDVIMNLDPEAKMCTGRIEKHLLRKAFDVEEGEKPFLPKDVLWRQKEQFSDGVGYSWIDALKDRAAAVITDKQLEMAKHRFPYNTPQTKEAYLYRQIFSTHFPQEAAAKTVPGGPSIACSTATAVEWDEAFKNMADPSGRAVKSVHVDAYDSLEPAAKKAKTNGSAA